jgi:hypothetical protein
MPTTIEPISPELALVDPDLARAHLEWLESVARHQAGPVPGSAEGRAWHRFGAAARIVTALSLAASGFLVAFVVAHDRPASAVPAVAVPAHIGPSGAIEQQLLSLVAASERRRLPSAMVDPATGLPKNNLQAVCRNARSGSQLCVVRPAQHQPGEGLYVRFTSSPDGAGRFTWYSYRTG